MRDHLTLVGEARLHELVEQVEMWKQKAIFWERQHHLAFAVFEEAEKACEYYNSEDIFELQEAIRSYREQKK